MIQVNKHISGVKELAIPCFRCGVCCIKYQVRLELVEAQQIAKESGFNWDEWQDLYIDKRWPGRDSFILRQYNGACVFLGQTEEKNVFLCLIQDFKPSACRDWMASIYRRDCQEGLIKQGELHENGD